MAAPAPDERPRIAISRLRQTRGPRSASATRPDPAATATSPSEGLLTAPDAAELELLSAPRHAPADPGTQATPTTPEPVERPRPLFSGWARGVVAFAIVYLTIFQLSVVRGNSMAPGIHDGDRILVEPWSYLLGPVERGDVVVLRYPLDPSVDYIKRVVGLPGDEVLIQDGAVLVNGEPLPEPYVAFPERGDFHQVRVGPEHYFVLGDNRPRSSDSRDFGLVPASYVRGRVELRLWPLHRIGVID